MKSHWHFSTNEMYVNEKDGLSFLKSHQSNIACMLGNKTYRAHQALYAEKDPFLSKVLNV